MAAGGRPKNRFDAGWIRPDVIRRCGVWNRCAGWIRQPGVGWSRSGAAWSRPGVAGGYRHRPVEWNWFGVAEYFRFDGPRNRLSERWNRFWAAAGSWFDLQRLWAGEELGDHSGLLDQTSSSLLAGHNNVNMEINKLRLWGRGGGQENRILLLFIIRLT